MQLQRMLRTVVALTVVCLGVGVSTASATASELVGALTQKLGVDVLPGMNAGASPSAVPSPMEGSGTAWVLLGAWALSPARPTPIHPRPERRGFSALLVRPAPEESVIAHLHMGVAKAPLCNSRNPPLNETILSAFIAGWGC